MTALPHRIRRLVLEVMLPDEAEARSVQSELARLYGPSLEAIIERCCTEASDPERVQRLESLELDLGTLSQENLEVELLTRLGLLLSQALTVRLHEQAVAAAGAGESTAAAAQLELLALFARTGNLPWWADAASPQLIDQTLGLLLRSSAPALLSLMRELVTEPAALQRLVSHCEDGPLAELLAVLASAWAPSLPSSSEVAWLLRAGAALQGAAAHRYRCALWPAVLRALSISQLATGESLDFWAAVLTQTAGSLGMTYTSLLTALNQSLRSAAEPPQASGALAPPAPGEYVLQRLVAQLRGASGLPAAAAASVPAPASLGLEPASLAQVGPLAGPLQPGQASPRLSSGAADPTGPPGSGSALPGQAELSSVEGDSPAAAAQLELLALFARTGNLPWWADAASPQLIDQTLGLLLRSSAPALLSLMRELVTEPAALQRLVRHCGAVHLTRLVAILTAARSPALTAELEVIDRSLIAELQRAAGPTPAGASVAAHLRPGPSPAAPVSRGALPDPTGRTASPLARPGAGRKRSRLNLAYSDTDEVYVENSGVVILWPFLELFFTRLELLEDQQFKDAAALHRAVGLVGYLVTGEPSPPEYQLALPKVLCGLETSQVFKFGPPVTQAEAEECTSLLTAVIANAPILREMSIDGFRGSFLLRKGVLSAESGTWLLRVERVSYDAVLDRFPWGMSWVKLPWMEAPLSVEW